MKVSNMVSSRGNKVANQFILTSEVNGVDIQEFQSYNTTIVRILDQGAGYDHTNKPQVLLDVNAWDYSRTTSKYRNIFLGESKKDTQKKIDSGEYTLIDLNPGK